ncbi:MAG: monovalent cation/H+ antiporter subunit D family protein [Akkermansiaceae bacterium]|nr:monovalent cation/H+ antiporter subunit D family protein [Akkermansiaceae bacterium]
MPETVDSLSPLFAWLVSLALVPVLLVLRKRPNLRDGASLVAGVVKLALVISLVPLVTAGKVVVVTLAEVLPGLPIQFRVDGLGLLFALVASGLWIVTTLYAMGYMRGLDEHSQTRFYSFFAVSLSATLGVAFAGNLLTLYLFYELLSLSTWPLVTHHGDAEGRSGGRTYLAYLLGSSIGLALPALIFCYMRSGGNMDFTTTGFLAGKVSVVEGTVVLLMFTYGFAKAGLMPLHSWLPAAMVAPTPVSALLHAVAVVKVGVFCVIRVFTGVFGIEFLRGIPGAQIVAALAGITIVVSSLIALSQDNLKRRLAFSTIGQLSYIIMGVALLSDNGTVGSIMHIATHAFGKITLFFCAGAIYVATGKKYVSQMGGLGRRMPWTMGAFLVASLSIIGLPPGGGAWSKWYLLLGTLDAGAWWLAAALVASTLLNIGYLLPVAVSAFFGKAAEGDDGVGGEAPLACVIPLCLTALMTLVWFVFPGLLKTLASLMT